MKGMTVCSGEVRCFPGDITSACRDLICFPLSRPVKIISNDRFCSLSALLGLLVSMQGTSVPIMRYDKPLRSPEGPHMAWQPLPVRGLVLAIFHKRRAGMSVQPETSRKNSEAVTDGVHQQYSEKAKGSQEQNILSLVLSHSLYDILSLLLLQQTHPLPFPHLLKIKKPIYDQRF